MSAEYAGMMFDMSVPDLDPHPYVESDTGARWAFPIRMYPCIFKPRPEYSQNIEDYQ